MCKIISIQSFRRGTGKSNIITNITALLASQGWRVGVMDVNFQSPSIHILFGLKDSMIQYTLNDYLWGRCPIEETVYNVTHTLHPQIAGEIHLVPASTDMSEIARAVREGYDINLLNSSFRVLAEQLNLDVLMIDTSAGLSETTLLTLAIADALAVLLRPDHQDFHGTGLIVDVARELEVPHMLMIVNEVPLNFDFAEVKAEMERIYQCEVATVLPYTDEMMALTGIGIFVLNYPFHPVTTALKQVTKRLMA
jgi:septum site-determining protein MinD